MLNYSNGGAVEVADSEAQQSIGPAENQNAVEMEQSASGTACPVVGVEMDLLCLPPPPYETVECANEYRYPPNYACPAPAPALGAPAVPVCYPQMVHGKYLVERKLEEGDDMNAPADIIVILLFALGWVLTPCWLVGAFFLFSRNRANKKAWHTTSSTLDCADTSFRG
eukprot:m51a1_g8044 hypothetical protein (168) ;mRNA; f:82074-82844